MSPAFDVRPPVYWMNETSGVLAPAVERYLTEPAAMTMRDIALMRAYLKQWIDSPAWDQPSNTLPVEGQNQLANLRLMADELATVSGIHQWVELASDAGLDPL